MANSTVPAMVIRSTECTMRARRDITLRSTIGPAIRFARVGTSAGNGKGSEAVVSPKGMRSETFRIIPSPSRIDNVRSMPGKAENGPSCSTRAIETRQSKSSSAAPSGETAISVVVPPPFFHGITR